MFTIYEYSHDSISCVTLSYLVATEQPLAGGYKDTPEDRVACATIFPKVAEVASLDDARAWIAAAIPSGMRRFTAGDYSVREQKHSQAVLCITAEWDQMHGGKENS